MYDIYLHVKKMNLKSLDVFLTVVLKHFELTNLGRFFMATFYIICFLWHYPYHSISIIKAVFHVFAFKIRNNFNRWKASWNTYSSGAKRLRSRIHTNKDED